VTEASKRNVNGLVRFPGIHLPSSLRAFISFIYAFSGTHLPVAESYRYPGALLRASFVVSDDQVAFAILLAHLQGIEGDAHILPAEARENRPTLNITAFTRPLLSRRRSLTSPTVLLDVSYTFCL
jgi:hypothetical protein